jgi:SAM-dependent methyltransferase
MVLDNKDFWEKNSVVLSQDIKKQIFDFELFMFQKAKEIHQKFGTIQNIKIFGCGTGREIESIAEYFNPTKIVASDISQNMIEKCNENLKNWSLSSTTQTIAIDAKEYNKVSNEFELVTLLNSMLTYVIDRNDRITIFKNVAQILRPNGIVIGTVHNQEGTILKSTFFKLRNLFSFYYGDRAGIRSTGFRGFKLKAFYYKKKGLHHDILVAGFKNIEIYSLEEYFALQNIKYDRKKGYNNLIFIAQK